jgi:hypothetical protein
MEDENKIGEQAEQEYEASLEEKSEKVKKPRAKPLSINERARILADFRNGKSDKFYDCKPDPKHPGEFKVIKRRKPLDVPELSSTSGDVDKLPVKEEEPVKEEVQEEKPVKANDLSIEYFNMQSSINNNLSKEISALQDKYKKLSQKLKEERARKKKQMKNNPENEYEYEYVSESDDEVSPAPEPVVQYMPYVRRRTIDIRNF